MSDEQSIREQAMSVLHRADCGCDEVPVGHDEPYSTQADAILASPVIRRIQAEALRSARADIQAYTDSRSPFGHRPVEQFLENRADRIERGETA
jgi:hypothetical protein